MKSKRGVVFVVVLIILFLIGALLYYLTSGSKPVGKFTPTFEKECFTQVYNEGGSLVGCETVEDCKSFGLEHEAEESELENFRCENKACEYKVPC